MQPINHISTYKSQIMFIIINNFIVISGLHMFNFHILNKLAQDCTSNILVDTDYSRITGYQNQTLFCYMQLQ